MEPPVTLLLSPPAATEYCSLMSTRPSLPSTTKQSTLGASNGMSYLMMSDPNELAPSWLPTAFRATRHQPHHPTYASSSRHTCSASSFPLTPPLLPIPNKSSSVLLMVALPSPINPPTAQHLEAPTALTNALATFGLFLCFPVTSSADGNPHYLFGAYIPDAHLLFPCFARSRALIQLTQDKHNCIAYVYHFNPTFTPTSINTHPTAWVHAQHHDTFTA
eukprot:jgi/Psemu1/22192/gm1.22192_g